MKILLVCLLFCVAACEQYAITKEYTDYLKKHVDWEVVDYEDNIFKGLTMDEAELLLSHNPPPTNLNTYPRLPPAKNRPKSVSRTDDACIHEGRNQGTCNSCWAISVAGMISDNCCMKLSDKGWLSTQELVACSDKTGNGCKSGDSFMALKYACSEGLVNESCFPYKGAISSCP